MPKTNHTYREKSAGSNERRAYPNIIHAPIDENNGVRPQSISDETPHRRLTKAVIRAIAISEAKENVSAPSFVCPHCRTRFIMSYAIYAVDTALPLFQQYPTYYCRDAVTKTQSRYQKVK